MGAMVNSLKRITLSITSAELDSKVDPLLPFRTYPLPHATHLIASPVAATLPGSTPDVCLPYFMLRLQGLTECQTHNRFSTDI